MIHELQEQLEKIPCLKEVCDVVANAAKGVEERLAPRQAVMLDSFHRSLQMDWYSCGAQCAFAVLKYYGRDCSIKNVTRALGTSPVGTSPRQLRRLFRQRGLADSTSPFSWGALTCVVCGAMSKCRMTSR